MSSVTRSSSPRWVGSTRTPSRSRDTEESGVLELVEDFDGDTYRAVCTVKLADAIYVLHVFQKKSKRGNTTPQKDRVLIKERLRRAEQDHAIWSKASE